MARATNIWMVTDMYRNVEAAFTVKHECVTYLDKMTVATRRYKMVQKARDGHMVNHHESPFVDANHWLEKNA